MTNKHKNNCLFIIAVVIIIFPFAASADLQTLGVKTGGLTSRLAPGDLLPLTVTLQNFGGVKRIDVSIAYTIVDNQNNLLYLENEIVALETTASFIKSIRIPSNALAGQYTARASMTYQGQVVPATTDFSFTVEKKYFGLFREQLGFYGLIIFLVAVLTGVMGRLLVHRLRIARLHPFEYSDIPSDERVFYELISDTVLGMRQKVGDTALDIATNIHGLSIDKKTGRVLKISRSPSKIIAELVSGYQKTLGLKVSFSLRRGEFDS